MSTHKNKTNGSIPLPDRLRDALAPLLPSPTRVVVAVSGGADSVALLQAWAAIRDHRRDELVVATFDHGLRDASKHEVAFVHSLAQSLELPFETDAAQAPLDAAPRRSTEEAARIARYRFLAEVARRRNACVVATAHTADDQVESVLLAILRGTGLAGLRGIPAKRRLVPQIHLVRPWLDIRRCEIIEYLSQIRQTFCRDESNLDRSFTRNRIRHELLPILRERFNPRVDEALLRLARHAKSAERREKRAGKRLLDRARRREDSGVVWLDAATLTAAEPSLACAAIAKLFRERAWPRKRIGARELERILAVARGDGPTSCDLPDGLRIQRTTRPPAWVGIGRTRP